MLGIENEHLWPTTTTSESKRMFEGTSQLAVGKALRLVLRVGGMGGGGDVPVSAEADVVGCGADEDVEGAGFDLEAVQGGVPEGEL